MVRKRRLWAREGWREIEGSFLDQRVFQPTVSPIFHCASLSPSSLHYSEFPNFEFFSKVPLPAGISPISPFLLGEEEGENTEKYQSCRSKEGGAIRRNVVPFEESGSTTSVQISSWLRQYPWSPWHRVTTRRSIHSYLPRSPSILSVTATRGWLSSTRAVPRILSSSIYTYTHIYVSRWTTPETRTESYTFCYYAEEGIKREVASSWSGSILPASSLACSRLVPPRYPASRIARYPPPRPTFAFPSLPFLFPRLRGR